MAIFTAILSVISLGVSIIAVRLSHKVRKENNKYKNYALQPTFVLQGASNAGKEYVFTFSVDSGKLYKIKEVEITDEKGKELGIVGKLDIRYDSNDRIIFERLEDGNYHIKIRYFDFDNEERTVYSVLLEIEEPYIKSDFKKTPFTHYK